MSTAVWPSAAVEKISLLRVGMVVLRSISLVITPPSVSTPSESGVTSSSTTSLTSPPSTPAWMAAPIATTSSGLTLLFGSLVVSLRTRSCTIGILQRLLEWPTQPLGQILGQLLELAAAELDLQVLRAAGISGDKRQIDLG